MGLTPPIRNHLHKQLQIHRTIDQRLHLEPCSLTNRFEHGAALPDQDPFLAFPFHQHRGQDSRPPWVFALRWDVFDAIDRYSNAMGHLFTGMEKNLLTNQFA